MPGKEARAHMDKALEAMRREFSGVRTGTFSRKRMWLMVQAAIPLNYRRNLVPLAGISLAQQLTGNWYPATITDAGLQGALTESYRFAPVGALVTALGGKQPGANLDAITAATAGVVQP